MMATIVALMRIQDKEKQHTSYLVRWAIVAALYTAVFEIQSSLP